VVFTTRVGSIASPMKRFRVQEFRGSKVQRFRVQRFRGLRLHFRPWTACGMRIYDKSGGCDI